MVVSNSSPPPFATHARQVVRSLRGSFSELLASIGCDPQDAQSIARKLGLNKNLAWKVSKIVQADDPLLVLQQMPGSAGLKIFMRASEKAGGDATLLQAARDAIDDYQELIRIHSGDRATMEMMGSTLSANGRQQADEHHRKLLFQGASYVWGAQARVVLKIGLVVPGAVDGMLDFASLSGMLDFRRLRPDATWIMASRNSNNDDGTAMATSASEPIDLRFAAADQAPLMADFCSQPLPTLRRNVDGTRTYFELVEGPVGNTGALTCVAGVIQRNIPYYSSPSNEWGIHLATCDIPAELMIVDLYFHQDFHFAIPPQPSLYSYQAISMPPAQRERYRLPLNEPLLDLGVGSLAPATPEAPRYGAMLQTMFDRMGWQQDNFHGFRMKIAYPAYPSVLEFRYRLPAKG